MGFLVLGLYSPSVSISFEISCFELSFMTWPNKELHTSSNIQNTPSNILSAGELFIRLGSNKYCFTQKVLELLNVQSVPLTVMTVNKRTKTSSSFPLIWRERWCASSQIKQPNSLNSSTFIDMKRYNRIHGDIQSDISTVTDVFSSDFFHSA